MNFSEIKNLVIAEYDSRGLKSRVRYRALDNFDELLKREHLRPLWNNVNLFPTDINIMKAIYMKFHKEGIKLNDAESSMINEVYNQLKKKKVSLTEVKI